MKRAYTEIMILSEGAGSMANVTLKEFSGIISTLEILMIKKYCLRNYLDSYKEVINDFVVNFDPEKTKDPMK